MGKWLQLIKTLWTSSQVVKGVAIVAAVAVVGTTAYVTSPYVFTGSDKNVVESESIQDTESIDDEAIQEAVLVDNATEESQNSEDTESVVKSESKDKKESTHKKTDNRIQNEETVNVSMVEETVLKELVETEVVESTINANASAKDSSNKKENNKKPQVTKPEDNKQEVNKSEDSEAEIDKPEVESEYKLVWEDNFDADQLSRDDWNVELHQPGWVNAEWQEYVDSEENIYLEDGKLVLQAIKTTKDGKDYYTSGRVNTQNKHDFKYGKFEARLKVPSGMGFLPAFWMMPTNEGFYGQWPKCGEIDIMEVMGQSTDTLHGTIHYGEPHGQKQGTYVLNSSEEDFAETFHVYTCEWEPGKITWYVDGIKFHEANDWYTKRPGFDEAAYPAPFDQPFYMIFNVAVGGSWVGYPDEKTEFGDNAQMVVDYVRVYQKDSYDENVIKPEKAEVPDSEIGANLLNNGEFTNSEAFDDGSDWEFLLANGGEGDAQIVNVNGNYALKITTTNTGTVDYSVQLVQGPIALKQGNKYRVSFDAWADEARTMKALISAPDLNYIRYWGDQIVNLTQTKQTFTYEFDMTEAGDANSRFEMTFGNMGSIATVYIDNVKVEKIGTFELAEEEKTVLPDGNYVYNSGFDTGSDRMKYWTVDSNISGVNYLATNVKGVREFKAVVPNTVSALTDVVLKQEDIAIIGGKNYLFTFDAYGAEAKTIKAVITPNTSEAMVFDVDVTTRKKEYSFNLTMPEGVSGADVKFLIGAAGTTYIDNVRVQEDANVINGNFTSGYAGWEDYAEDTVKSGVVFEIDELDNGSKTPAAAITINDTGKTDWFIQLKQPVALEKGKSYRVSFDAWSTLQREIKFAIQENGGSWTEYSGGQYPTVKPDEFEHFAYEFTMKSETDEAALLTFTMGAVNGKQVTEKHTIFIDNVVLEEIETPKAPEVGVGTELIVNGDFSAGQDGWSCNGNADFGNQNAVFTVNEASIGNPWDIQLTSSKMTLEEGMSYKLKFKIQSSAARDVKFVCADSTTYTDLFTPELLSLNENEIVEVDTIVTMNATAIETGVFQINMGNLGNGIPSSIITIDDVSLVKVDIQEPEVIQPVNISLSDISLVKTKTADGNEITNGINLASDQWSGPCTVEHGNVKATVTNPGVDPWSVQLQQFGINLENGCEYKLTFKGSADVAKLIEVGLQNAENYTVYNVINDNNTVAQLSTDEKSYTITFTMKSPTDMNTTFYINLGNVTDGYLVTPDGELQETPNEGGETPSIPEEIEGNMFERGRFSDEDTAYVENGINVWDVWSAYAADDSASLSGDTTYADGCMTVSIADEGAVAWGIQLMYKPKLTLEDGASYTLTFDATSSVTRDIVSQFQDSNNKNTGWNMSNLTAGETKQITVNFQYRKADSSDYNFCINMGKMDGADAIGTHTIAFDNFSLVKVSDTEPAALSFMVPRNLIEVEESEAEIIEETVEEETTEIVSTEETLEDTTEAEISEETVEETTETEITEEIVEEETMVEAVEKITEETIETESIPEEVIKKVDVTEETKEEEIEEQETEEDEKEASESLEEV